MSAYEARGKLITYGRFKAGAVLIKQGIFSIFGLGRSMILQQMGVGQGLAVFADLNAVRCMVVPAVLNLVSIPRTAKDSVTTGIGPRTATH